MACASLLFLLTPEERRSRVSKGEAIIGASWFETALTRRSSP